MTAAAPPPDTRHAHLRQLVRGLLEGVVLVQPDGTIAWANQAALAIHGCERGADLGASVAQYHRRFTLRYLNHHLLTAAQVPLARAQAGQEVDGVRVELRRKRDRDHRAVALARTVALRGADGALQAGAVVFKDLTEQADAEERFERAFNANPAPAVICRVADRRYTKVNAGFLEMTGCTRDAVLASTFDALDLLRGAERREEALAAFAAHGTIAQQEAVLAVPGGADKAVVVAGQPIDDADGAACILFTFIDMDGRKRAENELRASEERFSRAFQLAPVPMVVCSGAEWRVVLMNSAFLALAGGAADALRGQPAAALGLWSDGRALQSLRADIAARASVRNREMALRGADGAALAGLVSAERVRIGEQRCVLCVIQDITDRKRSEMELVAAIDAVMKDTSWFTSSVMEKLAQLRSPAGGVDRTGLGVLTPREKEVLAHMCRGKSNAEVAAALGVSANTVRNHVAAIYDKIGTHRRSAAVVWGRERGLAGY